MRTYLPAGLSRQSRAVGPLVFCFWKEHEDLVYLLGCAGSQGRSARLFEDGVCTI